MAWRLQCEILEGRDLPAPLGTFWGPKIPAGGGLTPLFSNWSAIGPAINMVPVTAGALQDIEIVDFGNTVYSGDLNVANTINRIKANGNPISSNDGDIYNNTSGLLPSGTWYEFVVDPDNGTDHNFPNVPDPGPMRLTLSTTDKLYFTGDHYDSFKPVYLPVPVPAIGSFFSNSASVSVGTAATLTAANVTQPGGTIAHVKFYRETGGAAGLQIGTDALLGTGAAAGSTWMFPMNTTGFSLGTVTVYAVATDANAVSSTASATFTVTAAAPANTLIGWDVAGQTAFGTQGLLPSSLGVGVLAGAGLARGSGVTTNPTAAADAWGGNGWSATPAAGLSANDFATFGFTVALGRTVSLSSLDMTYRRSSGGPGDGLWQYQLNGAAWTLITDTSGMFSSTNSNGADIAPINLSSITSLQNLAAGSSVNFRVVPYGGGTGNWYVYDGAGNDLALTGTSVPVVTALTVNDGAAQRSRLTTLSVTLSGPVDAASFGSVTLTRTAGGPGIVVQTGAAGPNGRILVSPVSGLTSTLTFTFDNANGTDVTPGVEFGSLADGRWRLAIPSLNYLSGLNDLNLHRLFGDFNADGNISGSDFTAFGNAFASNSIAFDFNRDGTVNGTDLGFFGNRFGVSL